MRVHARACAHGGTTPKCISRTAAVCPPVFSTQHPIYEEGALISAVTEVMRECCRKFRPRIFPEIHDGHIFIVMEKKRFQVISQAFFLSDLEGVIRSRFTL